MTSQASIMYSHKPIAVSTCLSLAVFLGAGQPVRAQWLSKWGHPVFTIGQTPYDSINTGHGNYPGGHGFIPGYGYYPGAGPGTYPWMDGPGTPFDRRKIAPALPIEAEPVPAGAALIIVKLPAEAALWVDELKTSPGGSYRRFVTPPLPGGQSLFYTLRIRLQIGDVELTRVEKLQVAPNGRFTVDFLTADHWTGVRLETLPVPRQSSSNPD